MLVKGHSTMAIDVIPQEIILNHMRFYIPYYVIFKVLSDDDSRRVYDQYGEEGLQKQGSHGDSDVFSRYLP